MLELDINGINFNLIKKIQYYLNGKDLTKRSIVSKLQTRTFTAVLINALPQYSTDLRLF